MPTKDAELAVRSTSDGSMDSDGFTSAEFVLRGAPMEGYALEVDVPAEGGGTDRTLDIFINAATATGVTSGSALVGQTSKQLVDTTAKGNHIIPFNLPVGHDYVKIKMDVGGTSPDFSVVLASIVQNVGTSWTRAVHFA
uniref:Uncharacterized protein n=1 Tax=viral metagenome TaxID=1070528 RepID=A0A6M3KSI2_9ZZZZ